MAVAISITLTLFSPLFLSPTISCYFPSSVKSWCKKTPYSLLCEYYLSNDHQNTPIKSEQDFLKISVQLALDRAMHAQKNIFTLGTKCRNEREKVAWADCLELYDHAIYKLNKVIDPYTKCSKEDTQTWLSTALTNLETCKNGFIELGVPNNVYPLMSNNVSKLISNTLAINGVSQHAEPSYQDGFPSWVKPDDRKFLQSSSLYSRANVVVAKDGSGNFRTINEAINAAMSRSKRFVIYVKAGVYAENLNIATRNIMLLGDGIGKTIITGSKSVGGGVSTYDSATVAVVGEGFIAQGITFRNTAGPKNEQAVALRSASSHSVFYKCSFEGYQDTLNVHAEKQFYRECDIYGTVDFIFGNAAVVFQNCNILLRNPPDKTNTITAQSRTNPYENTGIVIHNSRVAAASDLRPVQGSVRTYLGRPWRAYSRTVFMETYLDSLIDPAGWVEWEGSFGLDTLYYAEYGNTGPGSSTAKRVKWRGYHVISASEASNFTVGNFLEGRSWLPGTGVPFASGL